MTYQDAGLGLEHKLCALGKEVTLVDGATIEGYASYFGRQDQGGDVVQQGAYRASLEALKAAG